MQQDSFNKDTATPLAVAGFTLGLLAAAGAGTYLLSGSRGARNRRRIVEWVRTRFDEGEVNRDMVLAVVAALARKFTRFSKLSAAELAEVLAGITEIWRTLDKPRGRSSPRLKSSST